VAPVASGVHSARLRFSGRRDAFDCGRADPEPPSFARVEPPRDDREASRDRGVEDERDEEDLRIRDCEERVRDCEERPGDCEERVGDCEELPGDCEERVGDCEELPGDCEERVERVGDCEERAGDCDERVLDCEELAVDCEEERAGDRDEERGFFPRERERGRGTAAP